MKEKQGDLEGVTPDQQEGKKNGEGKYEGEESRERHPT